MVFRNNRYMVMTKRPTLCRYIMLYSLAMNEQHQGGITYLWPYVGSTPEWHRQCSASKIWQPLTTDIHTMPSSNTSSNIVAAIMAISCNIGRPQLVISPLNWWRCAPILTKTVINPRRPAAATHCKEKRFFDGFQKGFLLVLRREP